jgi:hypothetical protein
VTASYSEHPVFRQAQVDLAAHIRDPERNSPPPGLEDRRLRVYRELFFNNVSGLLAEAFPVLRSLESAERWEKRVRRFYADYRCHTPYFLKIAEEFMTWLAEQRPSHPDDPPFIHELTHYEWVEIALTVSDQPFQPDGVDPNGDTWLGQSVVSPLAWHLAYHYPVHQISPENQPRQPGTQPTYLIVYRDRRDEVHFLEINAVTYRLIELMKENPTNTGQDVVKQIATELQHPQPETILQHGRVLLDDLRERNIIVGTRATG